MALDRADAYRRCEEITRMQARNFAYGIRLLPPPKRAALSAVYAFARRVDDIGDGDLPDQHKLVALAEAADQLTVVGQGRPTEDPVLVALADAHQRFGLPLDAFRELVEGVGADVRGTRYPTFADLEWYCRCVAGSIGRLSLAVFGSGQRRYLDQEGGAVELADALGIAMQLTNILRDVREDAAAGRVYLPLEDRSRFGCDGRLDAATPALAALVRFEADRARDWFAQGLALLPLLDRRSAACVATMAGIYRRLLERISARPELVWQRRVSLPTWEKAAVAARSLAGAAP